jgi:hypothetical protein
MINILLMNLAGTHARAGGYLNRAAVDRGAHPTVRHEEV